MPVTFKSVVRNMNIVIGCKNACPDCGNAGVVRRFHTTENFEEPVFFENKLKMIDRKTPGIYQLNGMGDLWCWKPAWREAVLSRIRENRQHQFLFLTRCPERLPAMCLPDNAWIGVETSPENAAREMACLRERVRARQYYTCVALTKTEAPTEPVPDTDWLVLSARRKAPLPDAAAVTWIAETARRRGIPVFMHENLLPAVGETGIIQELPETLARVVLTRAERRT